MAIYLFNTDRQRSVLGAGSFNSLTYLPYGVVNPTPTPGLAFCGQYRDPLTGNYPLGNGHRFYSPSLMRFIAPDTLSPFSKGGVNPYAYCGADPVNRHDPSGAWWSVMLRAIGAVSSSATLFGSLARTAKNVVLRRRAAQPPSGGNTGTTYDDLPHLSRVSNQSFFITGLSGFGGQIAAAVTGLRPTFQTATDVFGTVNVVTNLSGGLTGNYDAATVVVNYLWTNPREIPGVALETFLDVTMVDEMLSSVARGLTTVVSQIRSHTTRSYDVPV